MGHAFDFVYDSRQGQFTVSGHEGDGGEGFSFSRETIKASCGGFEQFKWRSNLLNIKCTGESVDVDRIAVKYFSDEHKRIITEDCYSPHQVFDKDETGLCWK